MNLRQKRITSVLALFLVFSTTQVYVGLSFAGSHPIAVRHEVSVPTAQQGTGILTTQGNRPIIVNGAGASSGATMVSGAEIETPAGVGATVNLPGLGSLQIDPGAKLTLEFHTGLIKVTVIQGCVTLRTKKGTYGQVNTAQGVAGRTDKDGVFSLCPDRPGGAGAIPGGAGGTVGGGGGGLFGIGVGETVSLLALTATFALVPVIEHGRNPSPSRP